MPTLPALGTIRRSVTTLAVGVALLFSFAVNPGSASAAPSATDAATWTVSLFKALNAQRAGWHLPALLSNAGLANVAHGHNLKMAAYDRVLHQLPGELAPRTRIARLGFSATIAGENLAQTTDLTWAGTYAQQRAMYYSVSDGRRANILSSAYRYVGVDVAVDLVHHKLWITEEFGVTAPPVYAVPATVSMASEMLRLMNAERAVHGRAALRMNAALVRSAHNHNLRMASANSMSHLLPGELGFLLGCSKWATRPGQPARTSPEPHPTRDGGPSPPKEMNKKRGPPQHPPPGKTPPARTNPRAGRERKLPPPPPKAGAHKTRGGAQTRRVRPGDQPQTAPSAADPTSLAYLASTP